MKEKNDFEAFCSYLQVSCFRCQEGTLQIVLILTVWLNFLSFKTSLQLKILTSLLSLFSSFSRIMQVKVICVSTLGINSGVHFHFPITVRLLMIFTFRLLHLRLVLENGRHFISIYQS